MIDYADRTSPFCGSFTGATAVAKNLTPSNVDKIQVDIDTLDSTLNMICETVSLLEGTAEPILIPVGSGCDVAQQAAPMPPISPIGARLKMLVRRANDINTALIRLRENLAV
jgi:hypothetical protein